MNIDDKRVKDDEGVFTGIDWDIDLFEDEIEEEVTGQDFSQGELQDESYLTQVEELITNPSKSEAVVEIGVEYPSLTIKGIKYNFEIERIINICKESKEEDSIDLYVVLNVEGEEVYKKLGKVNLTLDSIIRILEIRKYELNILLSETESTEVGGEFISTLLLS